MTIRRLFPLTVFVTALMIASSSVSEANELTADHDVPGASIFHYYAALPDGASYGPLICYKGQSIADGDTAYGTPIPLALRKSSALACQTQEREFDVKDYGNSHFILDSGTTIPTYSPDIFDLRTAYSSAPASQPKVYFIFEVLNSWDALLIAAPEIEAMQAYGFQVIFAHGFSKADLLRIIADDSTYGIILDSHGAEPIPIVGWGGGYWVDSKGALVSPAGITTVSKSLKFFSALGCYGEDRAKEYRERLHLSKDSFHFLSGLHSKDVIDYYFRNKTETPYHPAAVWSGGDFSPKADAASAKELANINFAQQVQRLK